MAQKSAALRSLLSMVESLGLEKEVLEGLLKKVKNRQDLERYASTLLQTTGDLPKTG